MLSNLFMDMGCEVKDCYPRLSTTILLHFGTDEARHNFRMFGVRLMCSAQFKDHTVVSVLWALH